MGFNSGFKGLRRKSASCWFLSRKSITMHGPQNVKPSKIAVQSERSRSFRSAYCCLEYAHPSFTNDSYWIATVLKDMYIHFSLTKVIHCLHKTLYTKTLEFLVVKQNISGPSGLPKAHGVYRSIWRNVRLQNVHECKGKVTPLQARLWPRGG